MIQTARLQQPYRQGTEDLCGIAAFATAVRPFCGKELKDFLYDFWAQEAVTVEPTTESALREFYQKYGERKFSEYKWDHRDSKMFQWLTTLEGRNFSWANKCCKFEVFPMAKLPMLEACLREDPVIACVSTVFRLGGRLVSHVVNVWFDGQNFCLRDSAKNGHELCDGCAPSLIQAVELSGIRHRQSGTITYGMAVSRR